MPDAPQLYALTEKDRKLLDDLLAKNERFRKETSPAPLKYRPPLENIVGYLISAITGASGDITSGGGLTPGTGTAQRCYWTGTVWKPTTDNPYVVHNLGLTWYPANAQVELAKLNGVWTIVEKDFGVGKATGSIANGATGSIEVYWGTLPSATDSTHAQTMYNRGPALVVSDIVRWFYTNGQLECEKVCTDGGGGDITITVGTTTTGSPGTPASVTNSGTSTDLILDFTIPAGSTGATGSSGSGSGATGATGASGTAATVDVGTTTTGAPGSSASVTNSGSTSAAVFNFTIPRGDVGATGASGSVGATGASGSPGASGSNGAVGATGPSGSPGSGSGTVTSVSSGDLDPLFTVSIANPTSTPAFTFALKNATAKTVYGNPSASSAAPSFTTDPVLSGNVTAAALVPTGSTVPGNGMYLSGANTLDFSTNGTNAISVSSGQVTTVKNLIDTGLATASTLIGTDGSKKLISYSPTNSIHFNGVTPTNLELVGDSGSPGNYFAYKTNGSGTKSWYSDIAQSPGSPTAVGSTSGTDETADSGTWTAGTAGIALETWRTSYNSAGDKKLYGFHRTLTFDLTGRLYSVGAETRVTIDTPDACP
jgi:hypothetical protein